MNAYYFRTDKTAVFGAIKAGQLAFLEGKYQLLNSCNKIPFPAVFYPFNFQLPHPSRSNNVSSHKHPFKRSQIDIRKQKTVSSKPFSYFFFSSWVPLDFTNILVETELKL